MKYFSGFSLKNEFHFFNRYINNTDYNVCGFSYGAIKALKYVKNQLTNGKRVDTLILLSPAFFETKSDKFKKSQLLGYKKNSDLYLKQFIKTCFTPYIPQEIQHSTNNIDELEELLNYKWIEPELLELVNLGVKIEVYLGSEDKIIDVDGAREFFLDISTVTYVKNANHFLQTN